MCVCSYSECGSELFDIVNAFSVELELNLVNDLFKTVSPVCHCKVFVICLKYN